MFLSLSDMPQINTMKITGPRTNNCSTPLVTFLIPGTLISSQSPVAYYLTMQQSSSLVWILPPYAPGFLAAICVGLNQRPWWTPGQLCLLVLPSQDLQLSSYKTGSGLKDSFFWSLAPISCHADYCLLGKQSASISGFFYAQSERSNAIC